ncbi:universal stress protein F [Antarctobacter heliothermus]|uniref:Universal stress protein F n=1 Tax=Antarctobacter heliothermus TaxID=74033 RepID=A0A222E9H2_9RHOB|nr:universal stress protein [Antarctobacter heliothermus]ASP22720.1 universal stress protein F [Antarctobacter heliothermus]
MYSKILLAVDLNDETGAAKLAQYGTGLARMCQAEVHVISVVPNMGFALVGSAFSGDFAGSVLEETRVALHKWVDTVLGMEAHLHIEQGTVYDKIIRTADAIKADAIVVGAHRPELRDYLVGPNAARVVRHANQSVLVVR